VGIFENHNDAQRAMAELRRAGFTEDQIGMAAPDHSAQGTVTHTDDDSNAATGAMTGALAGAGVGAAWGLGIIAGLLPAIGPVIAGGTLAAILASAGLGAAAAGLAGLLIGMGVPEDEANYYDSEFKSGRTIITVKAENRYDEAAAILRRAGGHTQERTGEFKRATWDSSRASTAATARTANVGDRAASSTTARSANAGEQKVQVHEEELHAHKEKVRTGEVKLRKEVVTEQKTIQVPVQREEVVIERHPATSQHASSSDIRAGEEIRIPVSEEEVHLEKVPVVKEEVSIGKRKVQDTETVSGTVRKEQVKIEETGNANVRDKKDRK